MEQIQTPKVEAIIARFPPVQANCDTSLHIKQTPAIEKPIGLMSNIPEMLKMEECHLVNLSQLIMRFGLLNMIKTQFLA